jgi:hypothetical protein
VFEYAHLRVARDLADFHRVQSPLLEDAKDFFFAAFLRHQQHALLRLAEHDLVRSHAGFALRDAVQFDFDSSAPARAHLAGGAGKPGSTHVLYSNDGARLHGFETSFQQQLFEKWISDLNIRPLRLRAFAELLARHGGAVDAVAPGLRANINYGIANARRASVKNLGRDGPGRERTRLPADCRSSKARTSLRRRGWGRRNSCRKKRRRRRRLPSRNDSCGFPPA